MKLTTWSAGVVVVLLGASACGGSGESEVNADGLRPVTLNTVPFVNNVPTWFGIEEGIFEDNGLEVELMESPSPIPITSSLVSGESDFGFASIPGVIYAIKQGIDLKCVSEVSGQVDPEKDTSGLVAGPDSGIEELADLDGASVAVVQLEGLNPINIDLLTSRAGVDSVEYLQLPFPQMRQALKEGRVDAALVTQPFLAGALEDGATLLATPSSQLWGGGNLFCYTATQALIDRDPELVEMFVKAQNESIRAAGENEDAARLTMVEYMGLDEEQASREVIPSNYNSDFNLSMLAELQDVMVDQGLIDEAIPAEDLVWQPR